MGSTINIKAAIKKVKQFYPPLKMNLPTTAFTLLMLYCVAIAEGSHPLCENPNIDAALNIGRDTVYFFQDDVYYVYEDDRLVSEEPQYNEDRWEWAPSNPDAVSRVHYLNNSVVFFKANLIWAYDEQNELKTGYPKYLKSAFFGIPFIDIDAAFSITWKDTGKTVDYFFKGNLVWTPGQTTITTINQEFKLPMNTAVTAAFIVNDPILVTKDKFYTFDEATRTLLQTYLPQPHNIGAYFGCPDASFWENTI